MIRFLTSIWPLAQKWLIDAVIFVAVVAVIFVMGWTFGAEREQAKEARQQAAALARAAQDARDDQARLDAATAPVIASTAAKIATVQTVTKTLIEKVPVYVTRQDDARCVVNRGAIELYNASASGDLPSNSSSVSADYDAPSETDLSAFVGIAAQNNGTYNEIATRLTGCQAILSAVISGRQNQQ